MKNFIFIPKEKWEKLEVFIEIFDGNLFVIGEYLELLVKIAGI